jgi:glycosyltransferase involved in cell wall biosynthesis
MSLGSSACALVLTVDAIKAELNGIGRYTWEIARRAPTLKSVSRVSYFDRGRFVSNLEDLRNGIRPGKEHWALRSVRYVAKPLLKNRPRFKGAVFHSTNFFLPERVEGGIVTIHDVSVLKFPETHPRDRIEHYERHFKNTLKRTAHVITVSEHAKQEIVSVLGISESCVTPIHLGVDDAYQGARARLECDAADEGLYYGLVRDGYTLCVSTLEPRKNIDKLIDAYGRLPTKLRTRFPLVLVGAKGWLSEKLERQIEDVKRQGWLHVLGYVPEADLPRLYARARLFAYPSMYEGFGLPVAEAMAAGIPVITSDRSSLPEVGGGAVGLFDPDDIDQLSGALLRGLEDEVWRTETVRRGSAVAARYAWQSCVERTGEVYGKVVGQR